MKSIKQMVCALFLTGMAASALAAPMVLDHSPEALGTGIAVNNYANIYGMQYFAQSFSLTRNTVLNGVDLYSGSAWGPIGSAAKVIIWGNDGAAPSSVLAQFSTALNAVDGDGASDGNLRKHADFSGFAAAADTIYWISVAGDGTELAQSTMHYSGDMPMLMFTGSGGPYNLGSYQLPFRLYGQVEAASDVPEPASLALFGLGVAGLASLRRKRKA